MTGFDGMFEPPPPDWERDGQDWPHRERSRFVDAGGLRWHVQEMGEGPVVLLAHGTGASTHSFRDLMPALSGFRVVAMDLPGHAFTSRPPSHGLTLPGMARSLADLVDALGIRPRVLVGHSAGMAVAVKMVLDGRVAPDLVVSLNGALLALQGVAGKMFAPAAKALTWNPFASRLAAWWADDPKVISGLVQDVGSDLDPRGLELYRRLARHPGHLAGVLGMMADWDLESLERDLPRLETRMLIVSGGRDRAIPVGQARRVATLVRNAEVVVRERCGHLQHEEEPTETARLITLEARRLGIR